MEKVLELKLDIATGTKGRWVLLKKSWIVKLAFTWFEGCRRLTKDFEILPKYRLFDCVGTLIITTENMINIAMIKVALAKCLI